MIEDSTIRPVAASDLNDLKIVLDETQLFPSAFLNEMIQPFFNDPNCRDIWILCEYQGVSIGFAYCEPERMTDATWNVLAIAILPEYQSKGIGAALMSTIESNLLNQQQSTLIVETSGLPDYQRTRDFYHRIGYIEEATIRDFYSKGDDKIVFWKSLG